MCNGKDRKRNSGIGDGTGGRGIWLLYQSMEKKRVLKKKLNQSW